MKTFFSILCGVFLALTVFLTFPSSIKAQEMLSTPSATQTTPNDRYYRARVVKIVDEGEKDIAGFTNFYQQIEVKIESGNEKGKTIPVEYGGVFNVSPQQKLRTGEKIILIQSIDITGKTSYFVMDKYRLPAVTYIVIGFFLLVFLVGGKKGFGAIIGLIISIVIILKFIVPQILAGHDPLFISITGAFIIMLSTIFLAHGFSKKTSVALVSTFIALVITGILAVLFVSLTQLSGLGSDDSYLLQMGPEGLNLQGLLLGGIIIATLGVLDDITTAQSASIFEIAKANTTLPISELIKRGMVIGREHVASLVNTLVLAYAGVSLTLFILFVLNPSKQPYWVILNSEIIVEEFVRTIAGSIGLTLAVPITTVLAAFVAYKTISSPPPKSTKRQFKHKK